MDRRSKAGLFAALPSEWSDDPLLEIQTAVRLAHRKIIVLDDDPTGTQTVHDIPVLTEWSIRSLVSELANDLPAFYILTNSRSLPLAQAQMLNRQIGQNLLAAAQQTARQFVVMSRSDSTLRGHFPGEVDALAESLGGFDGFLLIPAFFEGGRYTIQDVHYVAEGEYLIPAAQTQFARDAVFGYQNSDLRAWVAEKSGGRISAESVSSISLADIRSGGPKIVAAHLAALTDGSVCIVNAASERDLGVVALAVHQAEAEGRRFLYRTAASFVKAYISLNPRPLLTQVELGLTEAGGGLIVIGSYVPKTSEQLDVLLSASGLEGLRRVEVNAAHLLNPERQTAEIARVVEQANLGLRQGLDMVVYTSRALISGENPEASLAIGQRISQSLVEITRAISTRPRYVLGKGGITSSDIATQALSIQRALVLGQIAPGVSVWQAGAESRYPGLAYIVFPGNVGTPQTLTEVVSALRR